MSRAASFVFAAAVVLGPGLLVLPAAVHAEPPGVVNARLVSHSAANGLSALFAPLVAERGPVWIGYEVPSLGNGRMCCYEGDIQVHGSDVRGRPCGCRLEKDGAFAVENRGPANKAESVAASPVRLETGSGLLVLFRAAQGHVGRVRTFSTDCGLDAGGLTLHWLADVKPAESLALLASLVGKDGKDSAGDDDDDDGKVWHGAVAAIAFHADPGADALLERYASGGASLERRKQAAFWMGQARGRRGFESLRRLVREDPVPEFREHAVFALTQSREPEATDTIIDVAKHDRSAQVRGQALFWLGQKASKTAAAAITKAIEEDPETEVKEKAVFALSQLPRDEGVPLLIQQARTNKNPAVRKQALFWLGQTGDPRALAFFEEILKR
jgi:hypothetical protein